MGTRLLALTAIAACLSCTQGVAPGDESDNEPITATGCGVERWSIKTGTDPAASQVNMTPQDTTIQALGALPVPAGLGPGSARFPNTAEMQVFRLTNVTLGQYKLESDSDYHLDINDRAGHTMITEIPSPSCVSGGPWASMISASRAAFNAKYTPTGSFQSANVPVTITGVGFYDVPHGQSGAAPNYIELHAILSVCFPGSSVSGCSASTPDFSLAASPGTVSGVSASSSITVTGSGGFSGSVSLSAGGLPAGASASFSPSSVAAGASSTLSLSAGSAAAGSYTVTVTGTSGSNTHTASVSWTIPGGSTGGGVVNGGFETGTLSGWTSSGVAAVVTTAHSGTYAARVGSTSPSTDSSLTQAVALPSGRPQLSFWYRVVCPDTIQYDWASVQVKSTSGAVLATPLANTCSNSGSWAQVTADLSQWAGTTVVISLNNHDDNYSADPTYTLYDDVQISGGSTTGGGVVNGGFETGTLSGWTSLGNTAVVTTAHSGTYAARVGSTSPSTDSSLTQAVALPSGRPQLSLWYRVVCPDTIQYDWASVQVKSASGAVLATPLANTCSNSGSWAQVTADLSQWAGTTVVISLNNHDDNYWADPTYTLYDDVQISGGSTTTPDFSLSLANGSVSSAGSASATDTVTVAPSGGFSSSVALSVGNLPTGASASFSPSSVTSGTSTLTLSPGTAVNGTFSLTVSGSGGGVTHTTPLSWSVSSAGGGAIQTVFIILMENHNWSQIAGSSSAPYINNTLLPQASRALNYQNPPGIHPSLPNYLWLEAGTNFGILDDNPPSTNHQSTTQHLVTLLQSSGISWRSYQEDISGTSCPLTASGLYAPKHNPMVYFDDVTNANNATSANCVSHVRPFTQLASDLSSNAAARYNFITPNLCDDMHGATGCPADLIAAGDTWLSQNVPVILNSAAYRNNGALFITWDESEGGDVPIGMIVLSPKAKGHGYSNSIAYTHSSTLRTMEEIFGVQPFLGDAANATDLSDLFTSFP